VVVVGVVGRGATPDAAAAATADASPRAPATTLLLALRRAGSGRLVLLCLLRWGGAVRETEGRAVLSAKRRGDDGDGTPVVPRALLLCGRPTRRAPLSPILRSPFHATSRHLAKAVPNQRLLSPFCSAKRPRRVNER
jgi:hypothetical protein